MVAQATSNNPQSVVVALFEPGTSNTISRKKMSEKFPMNVRKEL